MPHAPSFSGSQNGYETAVAQPVNDADGHPAANDPCVDASDPSPNIGPGSTKSSSDERVIDCHGQTQDRSASVFKTVRPQTMAQRECNLARKRKHHHAAPDDLQPLHPARIALQRLSTGEPASMYQPPHIMHLRPSLQGPFNEVSTCVKKMLCQGQSTSLAVVGPQGVGKSFVCQHAAANSVKASGLPESSVAIINLSGSLHKEELRALKYMARRLCQFCGYKFTNSASVDDNLKFLEQVMQQMSRDKKHAIFLLDDLACFLQQSKSRILYTLLDLLQRANVQAVVIGISCMTTVLDLMEKRARSRFSHKVVVVHAPSHNSCNDAADPPASVLASMLSVDAETIDSASVQDTVAAWNASVKSALADEEVKVVIESLSFCGVSYSRLQDICRSFCSKVLLGVSLQTKPSDGLASATERFREALQHIVYSEDPIQDILSDCSTLQIQVIKAALRLKQESRSMSFQTIMAEYSNSKTHHEAGLKYAEPAVWAAFQSLMQKDVLFVVGQQSAARVSRARQQVDLSISSADMRRLL